MNITRLLPPILYLAYINGGLLGRLGRVEVDIIDIELDIKKITSTIT